MLVDDDHCSVKLFEEFFSETGYLVCSYTSGDSAIEAIEGGLEYGLLISDRSLRRSHSSGDDVMETSRRIHKDTKIISFSAYEDKPKHADFCLKKPMSLELLLDYVSRYVKPHSEVFEKE